MKVLSVMLLLIWQINLLNNRNTHFSLVDWYTGVNNRVAGFEVTEPETAAWNSRSERLADTIETDNKIKETEKQYHAFNRFQDEFQQSAMIPNTEINLDDLRMKH